MNQHVSLKAEAPVANLVIRGKVYSDELIEVGGRGGDLTFLTPDIHKYIDHLPLGDPGKLADLQALTFDDILDYLENLGHRLVLDTNVHLQRACKLSYKTAPTPPSLVDASYASLPKYFDRTVLRRIADVDVGIPYLEGWVEVQLEGGPRMAARCFGARALHIVAGNAPGISALTIARNALLRSDAVIKAPSNDPFTALAIAETMCEMAPDHPITKHLSVAYWRGGDEAFEQKFYQPHNIEKIVAWGGFASVKHVTRYIQPGLELISLDPKRSVSIIGKETFESEAGMREAAVRLASDVGGINQVACFNARVVYAMSGTDETGVEMLNRFGQYVYDALSTLPPTYSTKPKTYDRELKAHVDALRLGDDWYRVIGGEENEGAIIVSQIPDAVDFATKLADRTANLVPIDSVKDMVGAVNSYTQTIGVYPESLKAELLDVLPLYGVQRFVSLGYALSSGMVGPHDGIEPVRRMGKWVINEISSPETVPPPWEAR